MCAHKIFLTFQTPTKYIAESFVLVLYDGGTWSVPRVMFALFSASVINLHVLNPYRPSSFQYQIFPFIGIICNLEHIFCTIISHLLKWLLINVPLTYSCKTSFPLPSENIVFDLILLHKIAKGVITLPLNYWDLEIGWAPGRLCTEAGMQCLLTMPLIDAFVFVGHKVIPLRYWRSCGWLL